MDGLDGRWFDPWRSLIRYLGTPDDRDHNWIDNANWLAANRDIRNSRSQPIRFVLAGRSEPTKNGSEQAIAYELVIHESGEVPTRTQGQAAWHDYFNALVWLAWPRTKQVINRRQADEIGTRGISGQRGALRDALTLFDESAVLFVSEQTSAIRDLEQHQWRQLFVEQRNLFGTQIVCMVLGHALLQKLMRPYKSVCGQTLALSVAPDVSAKLLEAPVFELASEPAGDLSRGRPADLAFFAELDAAVATRLARLDFGKRCLTPLPVLGVPGWWPANRQPEFYNDRDVFRASARPMRPADFKETKA